MGVGRQPNPPSDAGFAPRSSGQVLSTSATYDSRQAKLTVLKAHLADPPQMLYTWPGLSSHPNQHPQLCFQGGPAIFLPTLSFPGVSVPTQDPSGEARRSGWTQPITIPFRDLSSCL